MESKTIFGFTLPALRDNSFLDPVENRSIRAIAADFKESPSLLQLIFTTCKTALTRSESLSMRRQIRHDFSGLKATCSQLVSMTEIWILKVSTQREVKTTRDIHTLL